MYNELQRTHVECADCDIMFFTSINVIREITFVKPSCLHKLCNAYIYINKKIGFSNLLILNPPGLSNVGEETRYNDLW